MNTIGRRTWWDRHWKWFVPVSCVMAAALFAGLFVSIFVLVLGMMKNSGAYQQAVTQASREPAVIAALGQPIATSYFTTGNISTSNENGEARLIITLHGPKGSAAIHLRASKHDGIWTYSVLAVDIDTTHQHIDLLQSQVGAPAN